MVKVKDWLSPNYPQMLLLVGSFGLVFGLYLLQSIYNRPSSFTVLKGVLLEANISKREEIHRNKYGTQRYTISDLVFSITGNTKRFRLSETIGDEWYHYSKKHEAIVYQLKHSDTLFVWVKDYDLSKIEPAVRQITNSDGYVIVPIDPEADKNQKKAAFIFTGIGATMLLIYIVDRFKLIRKLFKHKANL